MNVYEVKIGNRQAKAERLSFAIELLKKEIEINDDTEVNLICTHFDDDCFDEPKILFETTTLFKNL